MTKEDLKKYAAGAAIAGALSGGAYLAGNKFADCSHFVMHNGEKICIEAEVQDAIQGGLKANPGFGGVKLGGK